MLNKKKILKNQSIMQEENKIDHHFFTDSILRVK